MTSEQEKSNNIPKRWILITNTFIRMMSSTNTRRSRCRSVSLLEVNVINNCKAISAFSQQMLWSVNSAALISMLIKMYHDPLMNDEMLVLCHIYTSLECCRIWTLVLLLNYISKKIHAFFYMLYIFSLDCQVLRNLKNRLVSYSANDFELYMLNRLSLVFNQVHQCRKNLSCSSSDLVLPRKVLSSTAIRACVRWWRVHQIYWSK